MSYLSKKLKSFICGVLAVVLVLGGVVVADPQEVSAATVQVQSHVRCGVGMRNYNAVRVDLVAKGDSIKKLKSNSKNLVVKQTSRYDSDYGSSNYTYLSFYAKKKGTYKITFDVHSAGSNKRYTSRSIKVHASGTGSIITSCKINGKNVLDKNFYSNTYYTTKSKGKVKFALAAGCKLQKIEVIKYDQNGNNVPKAFKNGNRVTFGNYGYTSMYQGSYHNSWSKAFYASTEFKIYYKDTYSNTEEYIYYTVYRRATKWY